MTPIRMPRSFHFGTVFPISVLEVAHPPMYHGILIHTFLRPAYPQGGGRKSSYAGSTSISAEEDFSGGCLFIPIFSTTLK